jgi:hypothetical protein
MRKLFGIEGKIQIMFLHASDGNMVLPLWSKKSEFEKWAQWYGEDVLPMEIHKMDLFPLSKASGKPCLIAINLEAGDISFPSEKLFAFEED